MLIFGMKITFEDNFPEAFLFPPPPLYIMRKKENEKLCYSSTVEWKDPY